MKESFFKTTIPLTEENRKAVDYIKFASKIRNVADAINKAIAYMMENDPKLKNLKEFQECLLIQLKNKEKQKIFGVKKICYYYYYKI